MALARADDRLAAWELSGDQPMKQEIVDVLADLFQSAGYITIGEGNERFPAPLDPAPDLAVWIDDLQDWGANPLLVEVKSRNTVGRDAARQLQAYVEQAQSYLGLLVVWDAESLNKLPRVATTSWPLIAQMSVRGVIALLRQGQFVAELLRLRNRALHIGSQADG
jgi:hypothetical protein